ncbi:hypothetical protein L227DRAFT_437949 [Lentinus tigrinus ALCF2SS1-6]|uniref:Uncharacterized protein n=1 Tax=Lentinus tigrinus ALCF2SS1-6 TaxID=1328759 RepID=A0A5C2SGC1_9APHY|nr:hypothetical protein L227DRAFT_437949 [Lentinus tigrinus ALCF2SS1-6]
MNTPIHTVQAKDRLVISAFSAISTGVGVLANCRDAPKPMTTTGSGSAWNSQPTRIVPGAVGRFRLPPPSRTRRHSFSTRACRAAPLVEIPITRLA